jgi:hypothetical protein
MSHARLAKFIPTSLATAILLAFAPATFGEGWLTCRQKCPPPFVHCQEGPLRLRFKCACPKPVCDPCNLEHYGYYQTCWRPWSFPPDTRHCPEALPSVVVEGVAAAQTADAPTTSAPHPLPVSVK